MNFSTNHLVHVIIASLILVVFALLVAWFIPNIRAALYRWPPVWRVLRILMVFTIVYVLIALIYLSWRYPTSATPLLLAYLAALIGMLVGAGELIARYRDAPLSALGRGPSAVYLVVNAVAAATAFFLIERLDWQFGFDAKQTTSLDTIRVLVAGFGAMALFRSSLFLARIGDKDVGVGPATVLQVVLNAADSGVDRETAKARAPIIKEIMEDIDPHKAKSLLPLFSYRLLQSSLPEDDFIAMKNKIDEIYSIDSDQTRGQKNRTTDRSKAYSLGIIMNYMGEDVLRAGVDTLGPEITMEEADDDDTENETDGDNPDDAKTTVMTPRTTVTP